MVEKVESGDAILVGGDGKSYPAKKTSPAAYKAFRDWLVQNRVRNYLEVAEQRRAPETLRCPHCNKIFEPPRTVGAQAAHEISQTVSTIVCHAMTDSEFFTETDSAVGMLKLIICAVKARNSQLSEAELADTFGGKISVLFEAYRQLQEQSLPPAGEAGESTENP